MTALQLPRFSIGVGDRFAQQAEAQLRACVLSLDAGVEVTPVWNKSNREHLIIHSEPSETRAAANDAVHALGWDRPFFVDADHIGLKTMERFLAPCDFFTLDVAESIGQPAPHEEIEGFIRKHPELSREIVLPRIEIPLQMSEPLVRRTAATFLAAVREAGAIYRALVAAKGEGRFIAEVSMDETASPQTPSELVIILAALADEEVPIQTIAPKFTGRFNKGVDYVGDVAQFTREFNEDIAAIAFAVERYGLPSNLKLSVHSGSDKFRIYPAMYEALLRSGAGVHLKTAGTTWLEELIGLAESGGSGLNLVKEIYAQGYASADELCRPYATVIDIDPAELPSPEEVLGWSSRQYVAALRHDVSNAQYNPSLRQLLHVSFKIAATMGERYRDAVRHNKELVAKNVTHNLFERHIRPVFLGQSPA